MPRKGKWQVPIQDVNGFIDYYDENKAKAEAALVERAVRTGSVGIGDKTPGNDDRPWPDNNDYSPRRIRRRREG